MKIVVFLALCILVFSCNQKQPVVIDRTNVNLDSMHYRTYADTIVCDMIVKSTDKDDKWMNESLAGFQRRAIIDTIFTDLYDGKLIATDYTTNQVLNIKQIKQLEQSIGNDRDIIGKFQFKESWHYDRQKHSFIKKVQSIIFGYEIYDESGFVKGYKPLFRVEF